MSVERFESAGCLPEIEQQPEAVLNLLEEYLERLESGLDSNAEELIAAHPELADVLPAYLHELDQLHQTASSSLNLAVNGAGAQVDGEYGCLGDFRILREIGRGGMGVVYEAEQKSLRRRVALKVLPFAATLDTKQLQRFRNEALAAAHLHHSHIVPVYAVGCERGVHYYAMQYIEGQSLAELIADLRRSGSEHRERTTVDSNSNPQARPNTSAEAVAMTATRTSAAWPTERSTNTASYFRSVAELGVQTAEALEHAHQLGIVHRDVKPGNIMVDAASHVWVADFGLARFHAERELTLSGDIVGTLRYMSPEQAFAKRGLVDHRSDIYSLGVTLYEAITLEPAYPAADREELIKQIASREPQAPRKLKPSIPVEVETIVLKAMAREPERRYGTAQEMADDLRRFLEHRPILAVPPTIWERLAKWSHRHRAVLAAASFMVLFVALGLLATTILIWQQSKQTEAALNDAKVQGRLAQENAVEAQKQRQSAQANFGQALDATMGLLLALEDRRWNSIPRINELRKEVNDRGIRLFLKFVHEDSPDPALRFETARAYNWIATVHSASQEVSQAKGYLHKAIALLGNLLAESPREPTYHLQLQQTLQFLGSLCSSAGQIAEAEDAYRKCILLLRADQAQETSPTTLNTLAWTLVDCPIARLRQPSEAVALAKQAVALSSAEGNYWNTLGVAYYRNGDFKEAIGALEESMKRREGGDPYDWFFLAMAYKRSRDEKQADYWRSTALEWLEINSPNSNTFRYWVESQALFEQKQETK